MSALRVKSLNTPGKYEDGGGLRLVVDPSGTKRWVVRVTVASKRLERGLGGFPQVSLEQARVKATEVKNAAASDIDLRAIELADALRGTTFRTVFEISFAQRQRQLSNAKHLQQWLSTMDAYVFPRIGD